MQKKQYFDDWKLFLKFCLSIIGLVNKYWQNPIEVFLEDFAQNVTKQMIDKQTRIYFYFPKFQILFLLQMKYDL